MKKIFRSQKPLANNLHTYLDNGHYNGSVFGVCTESIVSITFTLMFHWLVPKVSMDMLLVLESHCKGSNGLHRVSGGG